MRRESPIELKYHKMARSGKGVTDRHLKPKILERKEIAAIVASPEKRLTLVQKQLLWKYRYSLTDNKKALTKFLRCVDLNDAEEAKEVGQREGRVPSWSFRFEAVCPVFLCLPAP